MKAPAALVGLVLLSPLVGPKASAQTADPSLLTLDRIFAEKEFQPDTFGPARWLEHGAAYTTLEPPRAPPPRQVPTEPAARASSATTPHSGRREVLVPAARLVPAGATAPLAIEDYELVAGRQGCS